MATRIIVIAGPTASGKSALALAVAERLGGTIVNADSMQVYRDLAVVTARPDAAALRRAPHALYGVLDGAELCSAARWADLAGTEIAAIVAAGRMPVLCGGTGLYLRTLLHGIAPVPEVPETVRADARARHAALGGEAFRTALAVLDPAAAARLHAGDTQRLIRAYEVVAATGRPLSEWQQAPPVGEPEFDARSYVLLPPREALHRAIDGRFATMVEAGAIDEVRRLLARRLDPALPVMKAVGVPELAAYLGGTLTLAQAIERAQAASRQYAKRQYTWFRHQLADAAWLTEQFSETSLGIFCQKICERA